MNPSNPAKVGIAFAAGVVVALASAMIYVKTNSTHAQDAVTAAVAQQMRQPESLNAGKGEQPKEAQETKPVSAPVAQTPVPAVTHDEDTAEKRPSERHASSTKVARSHYPRYRSTAESQSTIRVEVSQMKPSTVPIGASESIPATAVPAVRAVSEDEAQTAAQPVVNAPQYNPAPAPQPHTVTLQAGTNLMVRLNETVSTDHNYSGDTFRATLDRPIVLDGFVIADKGSKVLGKVVAADKAGKFEGTANLQLTVTEINTTDGQRVRVETSFVNKKGPSNTGQEAAKIGGGAVLGAIIGAIAGGGKGAAIGAGAGGAAGTGAVMLGKGKPAVIATETPLTFQLSSSTTITERLN